jgi:RimJ/RimL family protein N-acetyltransferase
MNFSQINTELKNERLSLRPITHNDRAFVNEMFQDKDIKHYFIVPKEARQDYRKLVDYWLDDNKNGAGTCWIISEKSTSIFSRSKPCGFIAFEFRDTLKNARISYAIIPKFRKKGITTLAAELIFTKLKEQGVLTIEADIDQDNSNSEKVVEKLGFTANKSQALIDPEMLRDGEIRFRALWRKHLVKINNTILNNQLSLDATIEDIVPLLKQVESEIATKGQQPKLMLHYFYLLGRIKFIEEDYEQARSLFGECNMTVGNDEFPDTHLYFYWLGRMNEAEKEIELAVSCYGQANKKFNIDSTDISKNDIEIALKKLKQLHN